MKKWLKNIGDQNFKPKKFDVICSAHFQQKDFMTTRGVSGMLLNHNAVPSIFPNMTRNEDSFDPSTMATCSLNVDSTQINEQASDNLLSKKSLKRNNVHQTSTRSLLKTNQHSSATLIVNPSTVENFYTMNESNVNISDTIKYSKLKVRKIMHSSTFHFKKQEMSPRKKKMLREIKTLKEKLRRKNKKLLSLQDLCKQLR